MKRFTSVEEYIENSKEWKEYIIELRKIALSTGMEETVKWGSPVYTYNKKNVIGIGAFKNFATIWFFNGVFLTDKKNKLINAQEGVTKALRQWRFTNITEITKGSKIIKQYLFEAIEIEKLGKAIKPERKKSVDIPPELKMAFDKSSKLRNSFEAFSKAKQREFAEYILEAKREQTKQNRINKISPMILNGEGLNDRYK